MSLSLEVKKFINSEHIGEYVTVVLPSELPVDRAEVRDVNRDKSSAAAARSSADSLRREAVAAAAAFEATDAAAAAKHAELSEADTVLGRLTKKQEALTPSLNERIAAYNATQADYDGKNSEYNSRLAAFKTIEQQKVAAENASDEAARRLNECRVAVEQAQNALTLEQENVARLGDRTVEVNSSVAEARALSESASVAYDEARRREEALTQEVSTLSIQSTALSAESKVCAKRVADASKNVATAQKNLTKQRADAAACRESADSYALTSNANADKLALLRQKSAAADARESDAQSAADSAAAELNAATERRDAADAEYTRSTETLSALTLRLDEAKSAAAAALVEFNDIRARLLSAESTSAEASSAKSASADAVGTLEQTLFSSKTALLDAELYFEASQKEVEELKQRVDAAKTEMEISLGIMTEADASNSVTRASFEAENTVFAAAQAETNAQQALREKLQSEYTALCGRLQNDRDAMEASEAKASSAEADAIEKQNSIRTISTKYETAKVHYIQAGKGEDILLIHTVGQSLYTFRDLITKLSSNFRVTALDLVGFGYSDKPYVFGYTMEEYADFIARFMDALGIDCAHIYAFSMGAGYALFFARKYPERINRLVLMSPGGITPDMPMSVRMIESGLFGGLACRLYNYKTVEKMLTGCFFDLTNITDALLTEYYRPASEPDTRGIIRTCLYNFDDDAVIHTLRDVKCETLLLWGNEDKWHPTEMSDIFRAALPSCKYFEVRNAGHLAHEEKPERVAILIKQFIPCGYEE